MVWLYVRLFFSGVTFSDGIMKVYAVLFLKTTEMCFYINTSILSLFCDVSERERLSLRASWNASVMVKQYCSLFITRRCYTIRPPDISSLCLLPRYQMSQKRILANLITNLLSSLVFIEMKDTEKYFHPRQCCKLLPSNHWQIPWM